MLHGRAARGWFLICPARRGQMASVFTCTVRLRVQGVISASASGGAFEGGVGNPTTLTDLARSTTLPSRALKLLCNRLDPFPPIHVGAAVSARNLISRSSGSSGSSGSSSSGSNLQTLRRRQ